jgi:small subunit ribosomal protein S21
MLIIHVDHGEGIDRALKRYKNKHRATRLMDQVRKRKHFVKKSVKRRNEILDAAYRDKTKEQIGG